MKADFLRDLYRDDGETEQPGAPIGAAEPEPMDETADPSGRIPPDAELGFGTLDVLRSVGIRATLAGGRLVIDGPEDARRELGDLIEQYKPAIRAALEVQDDNEPDEPDGAAWVHRPDHAGRHGWEPAGLPPAERWWSRCDFDAIPTPPAGLVVGSSAKRVDSPE